MKPPTDLKLLEEIFKNHYSDYVNFSLIKSERKRRDKPLVPIDLDRLANHFNVDKGIIYGRLYFHLEHKFGFTDNENNKVYFFCPNNGPLCDGAEPELNCVNFPFMTSVVSQSYCGPLNLGIA